MNDFEKVIRFGYTNHRGEYAIRTAIPEEMFYGSSPEHDEQWLVRCYCTDRKAQRTFALVGMDFNPEGS